MAGETEGADDMFKPPIHRSMRTLDRGAFAKSVNLMAARVPDNLISLFQKQCRNDFLPVPRMRRVVKTPEGKAIVLGPAPMDAQQLSQKTRNFMDAHGIGLHEMRMQLDYSYWRADDILDAILPPSVEEDRPSGYTVVGHVAHLNLRDEWLPYKHIIGQVILDKNPSIRTVVNKTDTIDTTFRTFQMEVLAGEPEFVVRHRESDCIFEFDFSRVYWNSRLHTEHERLINTFNQGDAVCDVFAGVGPFVCPAGKKGVFCVANDLNPASYASLQQNIQLNKVGKFVRPFCEDGRDFIKRSTRELLDWAAKEKFVSIVSRVRRPTSPTASPGAARKMVTKETRLLIPQEYDHYVMNLPASAIEFLDAFRGIYNQPEYAKETTKMPLLHVHAFSKHEDPELDLHTRICQYLGYPVPKDEISYRWVRKVAPKKDLYCCSFRLPKEVAYAQD